MIKKIEIEAWQLILETNRLIAAVLVEKTERRTDPVQPYAWQLVEQLGRRGQQAQRRNAPPRTVEQKPGTGGFTQGIAIQQQRLRDEGAKVRRSKQLRPTVDYPSY